MEQEKLLRLALRAAMEASAVLMEVYESTADLEVRTKENDTPVTRADMASNDAIAKILSESGLPILSEETAHEPYDARKEHDKMWVVDPLDGTKEFIKHNDMFTVCIALVENHRPTLGVIAIPCTGQIYYTRGGKAYMGTMAEGSVVGETELPCQFGPVPHVVLCSVSHTTRVAMQLAEQLEEKWPDVGTLGVGSSIKQCMLASGAAAFYPQSGTVMEWDTAAGQAIIEAAGGQMLAMPECTPLTYNRPCLQNPPLLAIAPGIDAEVVALAAKIF